MRNDILHTIENGMPDFSRGQKRIASFILQSYDKAAFMTASRLGQTVQVSESTVVRFAAEIGCDGYPGMQRALQEMVRSKLTSLQRIEVADDLMGEQDILSMVFRSDIERLHMTLKELDRTAFDAAVQTILQAKNIYIMGLRSSYTIARFLGFYFRLILQNVTVLTGDAAGDLYAQMIHIGPGDVLISISFPRYSTMTTGISRWAASRGAELIALTDSETSPIARTASHTLLAKSDMVSFIDSLVAPLSLANALIVSLSRHRKQELNETLETLEQIWSDYDIYEKNQH